MSFDFCHDGHCYHLETTEGGQVHWEQIDADLPVQPLEPSEEES